MDILGSFTTWNDCPYVDESSIKSVSINKIIKKKKLCKGGHIMTNRHNIAEILLTVALNNITITPNPLLWLVILKSLMINTVNK